ncbi:MAG: HD domain-containing protein [Muribaculaceae bacterium]|nr:HD domain-containing protein [Muribaculaceae bacterium]
MTVLEFHNIIDWLRSRIAGTPFEGKVYAVGGCTRDEALGRPEIKDIDLAVELPNGGLKLAEWLYERHLTTAVPTTFPRYGTAMLRLREFPEDEIEIVQTRRGKYSGLEGSDPSEMFGPVDGDSRLRDLSINSLYLNVSTGELLDPSGRAFDDIRQKRLRTPDDPLRVFEDDPVRILRVIRFATAFGWEIPQDILEAMEANAPGLRTIKVERMRQEIEKMFAGPDPARALDLMDRTHALGYVFPDLCRARTFQVDGRPLMEHLKASLAQAARLDGRISVRLAAALHDLGKVATECRRNKDGITVYPDHESRGARIARKMLARLRFDSPLVREIVFLIAHHHFPGPLELKSEQRATSRLRSLQTECRSPERLERLLALMQANRDSKSEGNRLPDRIEWIRRTSESLRHNGTSAFANDLRPEHKSEEPCSETQKVKGRKRTHRGGRRHHRRRRPGGGKPQSDSKQ